jgi:hypothetical protein
MRGGRLRAVKVAALAKRGISRGADRGLRSANLAAVEPQSCPFRPLPGASRDGTEIGKRPFCPTHIAVRWAAPAWMTYRRGTGPRRISILVFRRAQSVADRHSQGELRRAPAVAGSSRAFSHLSHGRARRARSGNSVFALWILQHFVGHRGATILRRACPSEQGIGPPRQRVRGIRIALRQASRVVTSVPRSSSQRV